MFGAAFNRNPEDDNRPQGNPEDLIARAFDRVSNSAGSVEMILHDVPEGEAEFFMKTLCKIIGRTYQVIQWDGYKEFELMTHDEDLMTLIIYTPTDAP